MTKAKAKAKRAPNSKAADGSILSSKQELFIRHYTSGDGLFNATQAARLAGYKGTMQTLAAVGYENLRKPHIWREIRARLRRLYSAADLSADRVLDDLELARQCAVADRNWSAAIRASELHGKYLKLFADRVEHVHSIEEAPLENLYALAKRLSERIDGFNLISGNRGDGSPDGADARPPGDRTPH